MKRIKARLFYYLVWPVLVKMGFEVEVSENDNDGFIVLGIRRV